MKNLHNQKGMSAILFAMIFTVILSLLAIGFASLVRNDQRQTLDQSLGYQAQYAAETAVNQVAAMLKENPATPANSDCDSFEVKTGSGVEVSCVTWEVLAKSIIFDEVGAEPFSTRIDVPGNYNKLVITWTADNKATYAAGFPNTINGNNYPVLRVAFAQLDGSGFKQYYFVPTNGGAAQINYSGGGPAASGAVASADCSSGSSCTMTINMGNDENGYLAVSGLGQVASQVTVQAMQGNNPQDMQYAQYTIDATAIAQDITKRVQARVPYGSQTWRPGYSAGADRICKDTKLDGTNNESISGANGGVACPAP